MTLPDLVERTLYIASQADDGVEEEYQAHPDEHTAFGMLQVSVDGIHEHVQHLVVPLEMTADESLRHLVESETACQGKKKSQNRNQCQQGSVGKRRSPVEHFVLQKTLHGQVHPLQVPVQEPP